MQKYKFVRIFEERRVRALTYKIKIKEKIIFYKSYFLFICAKRIVLQIIISL